MEWVLQTRRLALRRMGMGDLDFIARMLADPEVMRYYPKLYTRDEAIAWIERQEGRYARDGHGLWLVVDRTTREPLGQCGLANQSVEGRLLPEIGYLVHRPYWRQGYASEVAAAVRDYSFAELGKDLVISLIRPINVPSQGVARKLGMQCEPRLMVQFHDLEHMVWQLTCEAWSAMRGA
jgi:RimJ/RimL family protein N-acetyltransferase